MKFNYALDSPSPLLKYVGSWSPVTDAKDTVLSDYGNSTAVKTKNSGDWVQFKFNGTGVW